ncbi:MAG TPA: hypothetical protein GXX38_06090 [Clostridia bacterium]|nr:hypothetical protein [Clostridia bacterium]
MFGLIAKLFRKSKENPENISKQKKLKEENNDNQYDVLIAIYDDPAIPPRIDQLTAKDYVELINNLSNKTYNYSREKGGKIPYTIIREVVENLIHANFQEAVVTILDEGNTIRVADQGPGIKDKQKVFLPGFSTATSFHKKYIRGVGSGLPIVKESINYLGGQISIEDNLNKGAVVTLTIPKKENKKNQSDPILEPTPFNNGKDYSTNDIPNLKLLVEEENINMKEKSEENLEKIFALKNSKQQTENNEKIYLSDRQKKIILLLAEFEELGPSTVAKELNISLSTAYRELVFLEKSGLLKLLDNGKRILTQKGLDYLNHIFD